MGVVHWVRDHKARSGLTAVALANLIYLLWCAIVDAPTSSFSNLLTPVLILSVVVLKSCKRSDPP